MDKLARLLSVERRLLELLLFKLVEGHHLHSAGQARFVPFEAADVMRTKERVQEVALLRSMLASDLARDLEIPEESLTLSALARVSVEPFGTLFAHYRRALLDLAAEIDDVTRQDLGLQRSAPGDQAVLGAVSGLPMPSLLDFLR